MVWTLDAAGGRLFAVPTLRLVSVSSVLAHSIGQVGEVEASAAGLVYPAWRADNNPRALTTYAMCLRTSR